MARRPTGTEREKLKKRGWTSHEDNMLIEYVTSHGNERWSTVAREAGLRRSAKSCRLRWLNYLRPGLKRGNITEDEEDLIIRLHKLLGNRWSLIAGRLPGRSDNEIKNYWHSNLSKKEKALRPNDDTVANSQKQQAKTKRSTEKQLLRPLQDDITKLPCSSCPFSCMEPIRPEDRDTEPEHSKAIDDSAHVKTNLHLLDDIDPSGINFDFVYLSCLRDYEDSLVGSASNGCIGEAGGDHFVGQWPWWLPEGILDSWGSDFASGEY